MRRFSRQIRAAKGPIVTVGDQAVSSATNFVSTVLIARELDVAAFGLASTLIVLAMFVLGLGRGLVGEPALTRLRVIANSSRLVVSSAGWLGIAVGLPLAVLSLALPEPLSGGILVVAVILVPLLVQDSLRFVAIAMDRPMIALASDSAWLLTTSTLLFLAPLSELRNPAVAGVALWACGSIAGIIVSSLLLRGLPFTLNPMPWFRQTRDLGPYYAIDFTARLGAGNLLVFFVAGRLGFSAAGALRGAQSLFGPVRILLWASVLAFVSTLRSKHVAGVPVLRSVRLVSAGLSALALLFGSALLALPSSYGSAILGDTWSATRPLLLPFVLGTAALAWTGGCALAFRVLEAAAESTQTRLLQAAGTLTLGSAGALLQGAPGAAWGLAASNILMIAVWERRLRLTFARL